MSQSSATTPMKLAANASHHQEIEDIQLESVSINIPQPQPDYHPPMEEEDVEKASDSGVAALITPASCTDGVSNASSQMDYISGRNGETSSSMRSTFVNTEDVHPFTCEHCSSALLNDESVDN